MLGATGANPVSIVAPPVDPVGPSEPAADEPCAAAVAVCSASKSVTSCPSRRTSTAKVIEAGPPPITATFRPVAGFTGGGSARPASRSRSAA